MRPVNLALRFALELAALAAFATWGLHAAGGPARFALVAAAVLAAAATGNAGLLRLLHHETVPSREGPP
jgi:Protein of unknown function (DUF2568)